MSALCEVCVYICMYAVTVYMGTMYNHMYIGVYSGTSLLRTLWDIDFSPYYRGVLNSEVTYTYCNTLQYYTGTQNGVLIIEVSAIQRFAIERFYCIRTW